LPPQAESHGWAPPQSTLQFVAVSPASHLPLPHLAGVAPQSSGHVVADSPVSHWSSPHVGSFSHPESFQHISMAWSFCAVTGSFAAQFWAHVWLPWHCPTHWYIWPHGVLVKQASV
jgi:hypothetical protein